MKYHWMKGEAQAEKVRLSKRTGKSYRVVMEWTNETTDKKGWVVVEVE